MKSRRFAEVIQDNLWVHFDGRTFAVPIESQQSRKKKKSQGHAALEIISPMPGKVTKLFVQVGQSVQKGQALLVMEAMKMEYTLKADLNAVIDSIFCEVGDQVILGKILIQLKEEQK